jgi:hypothetical protein
MDVHQRERVTDRQKQTLSDDKWRSEIGTPGQNFGKKQANATRESTCETSRFKVYQAFLYRLHSPT